MFYIIRGATLKGQVTDPPAVTLKLTCFCCPLPPPPPCPTQCPRLCALRVPNMGRWPLVWTHWDSWRCQLQLLIWVHIIALHLLQKVTRNTSDTSTVYTLQYTLYSILYTAYYIQYTTVTHVQYILYPVCTLYTIHCIQYTLYIYSICSVQYTLYTIQYIQYILYTVYILDTCTDTFCRVFIWHVGKNQSIEEVFLKEKWATFVGVYPWSYIQ